MWTAGIATVIVLPTTAFDPINVPKLAIIALGGFMALGGLFAVKSNFTQPKYRLVHIFAGAFILDLILVLAFSGTNFNQEFYGTFGRATGFIAYFSLCALLLTSVVASHISSLTRMTWTLLATGGASILYGLIQAAGADPFNWVSSYSPVFGFLGNPNFQSSFVGFNGITAFALMIGKSKKTLRLLMAVDVVASALVIGLTESQQGFLVLAGGIAIVFLIWLTTSKYKSLSIPALISGLITVFFVGLGSLNSGPLASLLYKTSVTYRGDYWRAGWKMTIDHPLLGVGLDSYGDWYRRSRTLEATLRRGPDVVSNAAHNVLLDLSSNGGFPLLTIYLFMLILVIISSIKVLCRSAVFDPIFVSLFAVWIAYQAQSIISMNQLGLAVWGWIISGLLIGYEINSRPPVKAPAAPNSHKKGRTASVLPQQKVRSRVLAGVCIGGVVGLAVGLPPVIASTKFLSALNSKDAKLVQQAAYISPLDANYMYRIADILVNNKLIAEATAVSNDSITHFSDDYPIWGLRSKLEGLPQEEIARALREMKRLDPHNPDLK
jgi:O-antigen ligase